MQLYQTKFLFISAYIHRYYVAFNIIKSTLRGIDRSGVPHIAMQFTTLGFLSRRRATQCHILPPREEAAAYCVA